MESTRRTCLLSLLLLGLVFAGAGANPAAADAPKPNIVFFFIDDMGWQDTSVPFHTQVTKLNRRYQTPNMEKLAAAGMKFTQAYACAVCSPSRVSLMTGLNAARHGVTNWTLRKDRSPDRNHRTIRPPAWNLNGLCATPGVPRTVHAVTLPALLRKAGYRTIHVGKAHFGAKGTPGENPLNLGFDVNIAGHAAGGPGSYHGKNNFSAAFRKADRIWDVPGLEKYHGKDINLTEALTLEANEAVRKAVADKKPFYLYMSHYAVHAPWEPDFRFLKKYTDKGLKGLPAVFASMIESMDKSLGDILANLEKLGVADNTIVVFMTDNGCPSQLPRNLPLRGHKITPYEGGVRVPMIVRWPGVVKPKTTCKDYLIIEDIFPTFLEMAGAGTYEQIGGVLDGVSFIPLLKQKPPADPERPIFWHFPNTYGEPPYSSVRKGEWKLIYQHVTRKLELYNLRTDIGEKTNLAAAQPAKLREMAEVLTKFLRESKALMPTDKTTGKKVEFPLEALQRTSTKAGPKGPVKIISYNVLYGFNHGRSVKAGVTWLGGQKADVVALQELTGYNEDRLRQVASQYGHSHVAIATGKGFPVGLTSRQPIEIVEKRLKGMHHAYLHCRTYGMDFVVVHLWPGNKTELALLSAKVAQLVRAKRRTVILGDFNCHHPADREVLATKPTVKASFETMSALLKLRLMDTWLEHNKGDVRYTCPSPIVIPRWHKDMQSVQNHRQRVDFILMDRILNRSCTSSAVVTGKTLDTISDHYPVVATVEAGS